MELNLPEVKGCERVVTLHTAKLAKEKGFDYLVKGSVTHYLKDNEHPDDGKSGPFGWEKDELEYCEMWFKNNDRGCGDYSNENYTCYAIPTQSLLQKWLRTVHNIHIELQYSRCNNDKDIEWWFYLYPQIGKGGRIKFFPDEIGRNLDYEQALERGLLYALEQI